jgi:hypothetical protein
VTILLSFLAITDSLTSLFAVISNFSGQYLFYDELRYVKNGIAHESGFMLPMPGIFERQRSIG